MAGFALDRPIDHRVEVELLAIEQALDLAEHLRLQQLELLACLVDQRRVLAQRVIVVVAAALFERALLDAAPARLVVGGAEVPLVVVERLHFDGQFFVVFALFGAAFAVLLLALLLVADRRAGFLLEVREEEPDRRREIALGHGADGDLDALFEHLLELLGGERRERAVFADLAVLQPHAHEELHQLGLEVASEVDLLRAFVLDFLALGHRLAVAAIALAGGHHHL